MAAVCRDARLQGDDGEIEREGGREALEVELGVRVRPYLQELPCVVL
jgi:hypothetical protein